MVKQIQILFSETKYFSNILKINFAVKYLKLNDILLLFVYVTTCILLQLNVTKCFTSLKV